MTEIQRRLRQETPSNITDYNYSYDNSKIAYYGLYEDLEYREHTIDTDID